MRYASAVGRYSTEAMRQRARGGRRHGARARAAARCADDEEEICCCCARQAVDHVIRPSAPAQERHCGSDADTGEDEMMRRRTLYAAGNAAHEGCMLQRQEQRGAATSR